jgi:iron complex outermembrane recepter protein
MLRTAAGALAALFVSLACAQDDAVVITATRFPDAKRDLPVGVTLITADDIQKSASSNLTEILAQFGLVHIRDNTGSPNQQVDLRGFGITGDQNTVVLVDGIRISENELSSAQLSAVPLESIERIEIVRGGGAVLYGGGASGGTINIITRRPKAGETRGYGIGRVGGYGTKEVRAGLGRSGEALGFSLDASHEDTNGYRRHNHFRQTNVAGLLDAREGAGRAYLRVALGRQHLELPGALTEAQISADRRQAGASLGSGDRDDATVTLGGAWRVDRNELAADLSYRDKRASTLFLPAFQIDTRVELLSFLPRAKLKFDALGREHDATLGIDLESWDYDSRNPFAQTDGYQKNRALYAMSNLWVAEGSRLVLGGRLQASSRGLGVDKEDDTLSAYEVALRQRLAAGWSAYGKLASSFRLATFDDICFASCGATTLLKPQTARAGEIGVEYEVRGNRLRVSLYEMHLKDEIYFSPLVFDNINLSPTERRGLEIEAAGRALGATDWRLGFVLQEAKFRSGVYGGADVSGNDVPLVPKTIVTAGLSWALVAQSRLNVNARYVGRQYYDNDQANAFRRMPAYTLVDVKAEHGFGRLKLALELRNLFDKEYYSYGILAGPSFSAYPQPGRALYASLAYRLD